MARMLLLVHQPANARLLQHWLSLRYDVQVGTDATALGNSFDLAIVDGQTLDRLLSMIQARRLAEEPLFLPFMLITARRDVGLVTRHLWRTVDELLIRPVQKLELQARVEVLLRARDLSRQRYHILRSAGEGILQVGGNGRILWANPAAARMYGGTGELSGLPLSALLDLKAGEIKAPAGQGEPVRRELRMSRADGSAVPVACTFSVVEKSAQLPAMIVVMHDLSVEKAAEAFERQSSVLMEGKNQVLKLIAGGNPLSATLQSIAEVLSSYFGGSPTCIAVRPPEEPRLRLAGFAGPGELGRKLQAALQNGEQVHPLNMAARTGEPVLVLGAEDPAWGELSAVASASGIASAWVIPVPPDQGLATVVLVVMASDPRRPTDYEWSVLTAMVRMIGLARERSHAQEGPARKLQALIDNMSDGVLAINSEATLMFANPAARSLLGWVDGSTGDRLDQLGLPGVLEQSLAEACLEPHPQPTRLRLTVGEGQIEAFVSTVRSDVGPYGALALLHDVTAESRIRRLEENFVANVSHELRGPLAAVSATLEALADGVIEPEKQQRYLKAVLAEIARLRRLSHDLIDLTQLDRGQADVELKPIHLLTLLSELERQWEPRCAAEGIIFGVQVEPVWVVADNDRLVQVLSNLLDNAVRLTPRGGRVTVSARQRGRTVVFRVTDTGPGISAEHLPRIWDRFYKVDSVRTRDRRSGTGLGLSIVRELVERMNGQVFVESDPGKGSSFGFGLDIHSEGQGVAASEVGG